MWAMVQGYWNGGPVKLELRSCWFGLLAVLGGIYI